MTEISGLIKRKWGEGPWLNEPDIDTWLDEETGYPCAAWRNMELGIWCGYVAVPKGHIYYGKDYKDLDVSVHWGLTFSDKNHVVGFSTPKDVYDVWWLGFDCGHAGDYQPAMTKIRKENLYQEFPKLKEIRRMMEENGIPMPQETYKDLDFVKNECKSLAKQLKEIETKEK